MTVAHERVGRNYSGIKPDMYEIIDMETVERDLYNILSDSKGCVREMCSHIMSAGGKRIRPLLVMCCGLAFSSQSTELIHAASAAELIHMASLVHDDIIDKSCMRRSRPSINKLWGNHFAVLCGDYLFAKAFGILAQDRLLKSMSYMVEAVQSMCRGEISQAHDRHSPRVNMKKYYERISEKTAIFLKCCCMSGAAAAGADIRSLEAIGEYGLNLGLAFQIVDDILDFCGNADIMGKPKGEDLCQGNITIPIVILQKNQKYAEWINGVIKGKAYPEDVMDEVFKALEDSGAIADSFRAAGKHIAKAKTSLKALPASKYTELLFRLTDIVKSRIK